MTDEYVDDIVPEWIVSSNNTFGRRSRLDDSAGEGLRRNVLVRNAMLSSLERERRQTMDEAVYETTVSLVEQESPAAIMDEEAQFFEDLLSELSGSDSSVSTSAISTAPHTILEHISSVEDEDFVQLETDLPTEPEKTTQSHPVGLPFPAPLNTSKHHADIITAPAVDLIDSCVSVSSTGPVCVDSGFAEQASRPVSVASCCSGYPNVCPYPAVTSDVGGSSEELPALIDDDSDLDDDDDDDVHESERTGRKETFGAEASTLLAVEALSRPLSPVASPVQSVHADFTGYRDALSPEPSRPTSPMSSASSKGDGDRLSPLLLPSDLGTLPSLDELTLQLPDASGTNLMTRPSRALGAWFENKQETPSGPSTPSDRIRWTMSPPTYFRPASSASSSTTLDFAHHRQSFHPALTSDDLSNHSIVVHWSR